MHGFLFLANLGAISPELTRRTFDASKALFAMPDADKLEQLARIRPETNSGFSPFGTERLNRRRGADQKEAFNVRRPRDAPADALRGTPVAFRAAAAQLWDGLEALTHRYCLACALALGVERDFFSAALRQLDLCTVRFLHYPPTDWPTAGAAPDAPLDGSAACAVRVSEHTDFGFVTVLLLDEGAEGLQIKPVLGGEVGGAAGGERGGWRDVCAPAGAPHGALVNTGALLARWTNDLWRATAHRVVVPSAAVAARDRYSIACFLDPDTDALVAPHAAFERPRESARGGAEAEGGAAHGGAATATGARYAPITGGEFLLMKLREAQGRGSEATAL